MAALCSLKSWPIRCLCASCSGVSTWDLAEVSVGGASAGGAPPFPGLPGVPFPLTAGDALPFLPGAGLCRAGNYYS
jgi:hypothetical protein